MQKKSLISIVLVSFEGHIKQAYYQQSTLQNKLLVQMSANLAVAITSKKNLR